MKSDLFFFPISYSLAPVKPTVPPHRLRRRHVVAATSFEPWFRRGPADYIAPSQTLTVPAIQSCGEDTINEWKKLTTKAGGSRAIDVHPHLEMFTSAVLVQLMFSSAYTEDIKRTFHQLGELVALAKLQFKIFTIPGEKLYLVTCMLGESLSK